MSLRMLSVRYLFKDPQCMLDRPSERTDTGYPNRCARGCCSNRYKSSNRTVRPGFDVAVLEDSGIRLTRSHILGGNRRPRTPEVS